MIPYGICDCGMCFEIEEIEDLDDLFKPIHCKKCKKEVIRKGQYVMDRQ